MRHQAKRRSIQQDILTPVGTQLREILLGDIQSGRYPALARIPSERELADKYGISRASVRESIATLISQGVLVRRDRRGAYVAPAAPAVAPAAATATNTIAFLVSRHLLEFFQIRVSRVLSGIQDYLHDSGGQVIFHTVGDDASGVRLKPLLRNGNLRIAGCILSGTARRQTIDAIRAAAIPLVLVDRDVPSEQEDIISVRADYAAGTRLAMRHLLELGHKRIGFLGFADSLKYRAYCQAIRSFGLEHEPDYVEFLEVFDLPPAILAGYEAMDRMLSRRNLPSSLLVTNDLVAVGVMERLHIAGLRVPTDLSVVGFDDLGQRTNPPLTRVRLDLSDLGRIAAENLLKRVQGQPVPEQHILVPIEFILAGSTAAPQQSR